jgi:hypothetical protein
MPDSRSPGQYWRSGSVFRYKWGQGKQSGDVVVKDGREEGIFLLPDRKGVLRGEGSISVGDGMAGPRADPWLQSLFTFLGDTKKPGRYTFDEMLSLPSGVRAVSCERRLEGGRELVLVKTRWEKSTTEFWFDPSVNYLIRKLSTTIPGKRTDVYTTEVIRFREPASGIYFPEQVKVVSSSDNRHVATETFTFTDIEINRPLPPTFFEMRFPPGTPIRDQLKGTTYVAGEDGRPVGEATLSPSPPPPPAIPAVEPRAETKEEPRSWSWVILPASLSVLALAVCLYAVQRWRTRAY